MKGQRYSEYRVDAVKRIQEIGKSKVDHPLYQINYFESFQVSLKLVFFRLILLI
jgi:hypothetical protein